MCYTSLDSSFFNPNNLLNFLFLPIIGAKISNKYKVTNEVDAIKNVEMICNNILRINLRVAIMLSLKVVRDAEALYVKRGMRMSRRSGFARYSEFIGSIGSSETWSTSGLTGAYVFFSLGIFIKY